MSQEYLLTITENASRLGMRIQESLSEHTRELTLPSVYLDSVGDDKIMNIRKQLDSNSDREKLDAMKRLIALLSKGRNVSEYFAQVVKNVASHNLEIRKLVYIYLLRYAEQEPDLALLSINTFQKDLTDSNPLIRAMALRVLSGIKVPMIGSLVVMSIKKCAADVSPYVRKVAALAIPKCFDLDNSLQTELIQILSNLLRDRSSLVVGCVCFAFEALCPTRLDLLHTHYRRLCRILVDVEEWGQIDLMNLLLRYARTMLPRPDGEEMDKDVRLLLTSVKPLFQSRNSAVVLATARVVYYVGPSSWHMKLVQPLLRLLHNSPEVERTVLADVLVISRKDPSLFASSFTQFCVRSSDLTIVKRLKIMVLLTLVNFENHQAILREFIDYADDPDGEVVSAAILAIGTCARTVPECTQQCLNALNSMLHSAHGMVVSSAVLVLKSLVQTQALTGALAIISNLAKKIDAVQHPEARACVLWLVGQYGAADVVEAPDVLRKVAKTFTNEPVMVKLQTLTLAAKLFVSRSDDKVIELLTGYVFSLARYDVNYDVRDRARMLSSLTGTSQIGVEERGGVVLRREQVRLVLFDGKSASAVQEPEMRGHHDGSNALLGSTGLVTGKPSMQILPEWLERGVSSTLRDTEEDLAPVVVAPVPTAISSAMMARGGPVPRGPVVLTPGAGAVPQEPAKPKWKDLDTFYAEEDEGEDEEEESEEEESDEDGEEDAGNEKDEESSGSREPNESDEETESENEKARAGPS